MDFGLSQDQKLMVDSLEKALGQLCPLERVRAFADKDEPVARDLWAGLAEIGIAGLMIAEEHGGLDLSLLDAALAAEAFGRHVAPTPFLGVTLAAIALRAAGSSAQQSRWLPALAAGEALAGIAISEAVAGARDGAGVTAQGGKLTGTSLFVIDAAEADLFIVADTAGALHLVAGDAPGITRIVLTSIDLTRRLGEVRLKDTPAEPLSAGPLSAGDALTRVRDAAWTLIAADTLGAGQRMIEKAVAYAAERKQFGRVIGSFQAVKHLCAEMAAELEPCRSLVWYAAHAWSAVPDEASVTAAHAKAHLSEVGRFVARTSTEVHGGIGITDLLGLHYWFKRIGLDRQLLGGPERVRHHAAVIQGLVNA
jgi:alkylation response protein AidB-like acyl-CoA dehydrogenase